MTTTAHLGITLLDSAQAQKEITVNEALARIDAVLNIGALDKDLATPPGSPAAGDVYIIASSPTGAWSGKAKQVAYYDQIWRFIVPNEGMMLWVDDENLHYVYNGSAWVVAYSPGMSTGTYDPANIAQQVVGTTATQTLTNKTLQSPIITTSLCGVTGLVAEGRLTLTSGTAITSSDVTAATSVYYTPCRGTHIALYDTTATLWRVLPFSQITISVPATTNTIYDVFIYNNSGTPTAETVAWTNDTTRATALALQNGIYVKSTDAARRYVGSFRTTGASGQTEDSREKRYVWNYYNRVARLLTRTDATVSWAYSTATVRQANASTSNQLGVLIGVIEDTIHVTLQGTASNSTATARGISGGIGVNSTTTYASLLGAAGVAYVTSAQTPGIWAMISALPPSVGLTNYVWLEKGAGTDTQTWFGNSSYGLSGKCYG